MPDQFTTIACPALFSMSIRYLAACIPLSVVLQHSFQSNQVEVLKIAENFAFCLRLELRNWDCCLFISARADR